jgi:phage terminase small subunit
MLKIADKKVTIKQAKFIEEYLKTGNATQAVYKSYNVKAEHTAASIGSENLRKPDIKALIESFAESAAKRISQLSAQDENLTVALGASKDILDRAGFKPKEEEFVQNNLIINWDHGSTATAKEDSDTILTEEVVAETAQLEEQVERNSSSPTLWKNHSDD